MGARPPSDDLDDLFDDGQELSKAPSPSPDAVDLLDDLDLDAAERMAVGEELRLEPGRWRATGGMGELREVHDRLLDRRLVRKRPRDDQRDVAGRRAFVHEAQVTAGLNHPSIVPLFDLSWDADGLYYLMPWVEGHNLGQVLEGLRARDPGERTADIGRLLEVFRTICGAIAHAHERGVVHRDLKPDQIILGPHGEVVVTDWGLAARFGGVVDVGPGSSGSLGGSIRSGRTVLSGVQGVVRYLAPERLEPGPIPAHPAQDVFALGAVLYRILTLRTPVGRRRDDEKRSHYIARARRELRSVRRPSALAWTTYDPVWDDVCMRCLAYAPGDRYSDGQELYSDVEDALSAIEERRRRRARADEALAAAREVGGRLRQARAGLERARGRRRELAEGIPGHASVEAKRPLWEAEDEEARLRRELATLDAEVERQLLLALDHDPTHPRARARLSDLYAGRLSRAEAEGDPVAGIYAMARLRRHDAERAASLASGVALLGVGGAPDGAQVRLAPLVERDRRLVPGPWRGLGRTPLEPVELDAGRYMVRVVRRGYCSARYALRLDIGEVLTLRPAMPRRGRVPRGFAYVPAGPAILGGDPVYPDAGPRRRAWIRDFAIGVFPVTMGEYLEFLDDLPLEEAREHLPGVLSSGEAPFARRRGSWAIRQVKYGSIQSTPSFPILNLTEAQIASYVAWRSRRDGRAFRLPRRDEWEYAARSGDGRLFPWGDRFVANYCWCAESTAEGGVPAEVGRAPLDVSPAGVHDLAGCAGDWLADDFNADEGLRHIAGGTWFASRHFVRVARRFGQRVGGRSGGLGFRLALDL